MAKKTPKPPMTLETCIKHTLKDWEELDYISDIYYELVNNNDEFRKLMTQKIREGLQK